MANESHKQQLLAQQKELEERLERTAKHLYKREERYSADFAEQVVEVENNEVVEQLDEEGKVELAKINRALSKIQNGGYGVCEQCQSNIGEQRLDAVPYTDLCITCAKAV